MMMSCLWCKLHRQKVKINVHVDGFITNYF